MDVAIIIGYRATPEIRTVVLQLPPEVVCGHMDDGQFLVGVLILDLGEFGVDEPIGAIDLERVLRDLKVLTELGLGELVVAEVNRG